MKNQWVTPTAAVALFTARRAENDVWGIRSGVASDDFHPVDVLYHFRCQHIRGCFCGRDLSLISKTNRSQYSAARFRSWNTATTVMRAWRFRFLIRLRMDN